MQGKVQNFTAQVEINWKFLFFSVLDRHVILDFSLASEEKAKNSILKKGTILENEMFFASKIIMRQNPHLLLDLIFQGFLSQISPVLWKITTWISGEILCNFSIICRQTSQEWAKRQQASLLGLDCPLLLQIHSEVNRKG